MFAFEGSDFSDAFFFSFSGEGRYVVDVDTSRNDFLFGALILGRKPAGTMVTNIISDKALVKQLYK